MPDVNPEILIWARETAGLTLEDASNKLGFHDSGKRTAAERLDAYEAGHEAPSRSVLSKMAGQYHRPLLTFYLSAPPQKSVRGIDFRTLNAADTSPVEDARLDALLRDVQARQSLLRAAMEDEDDTPRLQFIRAHKTADGQSEVLKSLRNLLGVSHETYYEQKNEDDAFALLRDAAESAGVFVLLKGDLGSYHTELDTRIFRGFTIADEVAPFIVINEYDARSAWAFTLLHEMAHLFLGQTGISGAHTDTEIERFCDDVAGRYLLPESEIRKLDMTGAHDIADISRRISDFASERNISRSMAAYRSYRTDMLDYQTYMTLSRQFRDEWLENRTARSNRNRRNSGGPNYYIVRRHRIGKRLAAFVKRMLTDESLSTTKAATVLGVKPQQVQQMLAAGS